MADDDFILQEDYWKDGDLYRFDIVENRETGYRETSPEATVIKYSDGEIIPLVNTNYEEAAGQLSNLDELPEEAQEKIDEMVNDVVKNII